MNEPSSTPTRSPDGPRTTVVFVHGMGSQRRYADLSGLAESIDQHVRSTSKDRIVGIDVKVESSTRIARGNIAYLEARWLPSDEGAAARGLRFYEAYWAPLAAAGVPARQVVAWMFRQVPKPISALLLHWRERPRLRRSVLASLDDVTDWQRTMLFRAYDEFEGHKARRKFPDGSFNDFLAFLRTAEDIPRGEAEVAQFVAISKRWRRAYLAKERWTLFALVTLAVGLLSLLGLAVLTLVRVLGLFEGVAVSDMSFETIVDYIWDRRTTFTLAGSLLFVIPGVGSGLSAYLGDVVLWTTYEETQERYRTRQAILVEVTSVLRHAIESDWSDRVVVVSHSLGTAIASDALMYLGRELRALHGTEHQAALHQLRKVTHLVTYGSPVDKIHYFFEHDGKRRHRYHRVVEDLRGDLGTEPFGNNNGKRWIHWVNFWDPADVVSGPLETPVNRRNPGIQIDNVSVIGTPIANPMSAHTHYLDRREVLDALVEVITQRDSGRADGPPDRRSSAFGPGKERRSARWQQAGAILAIWLLTVAFVAFGLSGRVDLAAATLLGIAIVGLAIVLFTRWRSFALAGEAILAASSGPLRR